MTDSNEKIDDLIKALSELKKEKNIRKEEQKKSILGFNLEKDKLNQSSEKIMSYLKLINGELKNCQENKNIISKGILNEKSVIKLKKDEIKFALKKFNYRESLLTDLMKQDSYQTIYNIFVSFLILLIGIHTVSQYIENHTFFQASLFFNYFNGFFSFLFFHFIKIIISVFFIIFLQIIKDIYQRGNKSLSRILFYLSFILLLYSFNYIFNTSHLSLVCKLLHFFNNVTVMLKIYSYYCEKVLKVSYKLNNEINGGDDKQIGHGMSIVIKDDGMADRIVFEFKKVNLFREISGFIHFYLSPTLVYRDVYPREKKKNLYKLFIHAVNVVLTFIFCILIFETKINPMFEGVKLHFLDVYTLIQILVAFIMFSIILLFMFFYGLAHSYLNFSAEMTKFGDRLFYQDFYSARSPIKFYKKLLLYYEDFLDNYFKHFYGKFSFAIVRIAFYCFLFEYAYLNSSGLSCPFLSIVFTVTHILSYPLSLFKSQKKVLLNWLIVSLGMGLMVMVNYVEYIFYNSNDGNNNRKLYSIFIPKLWFMITNKFY